MRKKGNDKRTLKRWLSLR